MNANETALETEKEQFLFFREAVCWIACGSYEFPPIGPRDYYDFLISDAMFEPEMKATRADLSLLMTSWLPLLRTARLRFLENFHERSTFAPMKMANQKSHIRLKCRPLR